MNGQLRWILAALVLTLATACAPRQLKPVASVAPAPLLEAIHERQAVFEKGLSGTLELSFVGEQRFSGKVYIVAFPDGRFRLEVPGPFGGTHLVMVSDNTRILAFYPGEGRAYQSSVGGRSLNPYLPFPLPVDPGSLPPMAMGALPGGSGLTGIRAHLMDSGETLLEAATADGDLRYSWLFGRSRENRIDKITILGKNIRVLVRTAGGGSSLPREFDLELADGSLRGEWDKVSPFDGNGSVFGIRLPPTVTVTDLDAAP